VLDREDAHSVTNDLARVVRQLCALQEAIYGRVLSPIATDEDLWLFPEGDGVPLLSR